MKQSEFRTLKQWIRRDALAIGVDLTEHALSSIALHLQLVLRTTQTFNLIAPIEPQDAVRRHVIDSLTALPEVLAAAPGAMADIGSGAGFPGLPLSVVSERATSLIESSHKKARFLADAVKETGAPCEVLATRSEQLALERPAGFAVVVVRAVAKLPVLVELAAPLLEEGGRLIAMKGDPAADEIRNGELAAEICGLRLVVREPVVLPGVNESRVLVVFQREGEATIALPRRSGVARKRPLA